MTAVDTASTAWSGSWAAQGLGMELHTDSGAGGLTIQDLVGLALRINPRRAHLLVSRVLGKHIPSDPRLVLGAGRLLGALVSDHLSGRGGGIADTGGMLLASALAGTDDAAPAALLELCDRHRAQGPAVDALVLGYAETATGLGHTVADALGGDYLHSTRRPVAGIAQESAFEEAHSHATSHLLLPEDPRLLTAPRPLVLVDDELSTGETVMDTIRAVQEIAPRERFVVAALVDLRSPANRRRLREFADRNGVRVDVVTLVTGRIRLPEDAGTRGRELATTHGRPPITDPGPLPRDGGPREAPAGARWPHGVREGGRHGFLAGERSAFDDAVRTVTQALLPALPTQPGTRVLVLGTEELMYLPLRLAAALADQLADTGVEIRFSSTTRSPVVPVDEPGYAIRTALTFDSHDDPADGPGTRYAYNVPPPMGGAAFDAAVLVVDDVSRAWCDGGSRLPDRLAAAVAGPVIVLTVPSHRPRTVTGALR